MSDQDHPNNPRLDPSESERKRRVSEGDPASLQELIEGLEPAPMLEDPQQGKEGDGE